MLDRMLLNGVIDGIGKPVIVNDTISVQAELPRLGDDPTAGVAEMIGEPLDGHIGLDRDDLLIAQVFDPRWMHVQKQQHRCRSGEIENNVVTDANLHVGPI